MKEKVNSIILLRVLNLLFFLGMITVNALANILPINGMNTGEISDFYPNLFTPTALTFSVWGLIYLLLALFVLFQFGLFGGKESESLISKKIGVWFIVSCTANLLWILAWHNLKIVLSVCLMLVLLVSLIVIVTKLGRSENKKEQFFVRLPFFVYFGWITVATIANVTALLVSLRWSGFGLTEADWTVMMLAVGTLIASGVILRFKTISYGLVIIWAYTGILIKHLSQNGFNAAYPHIVIAAAVCVAIIVIDCCYIIVRKRRTSD
mgnify:FL=1